MLAPAGRGLSNTEIAARLVLFFVRAGYTHVRACDLGAQFGLALGFLALAVTTPAVNPLTR